MFCTISCIVPWVTLCTAIQPAVNYCSRDCSFHNNNQKYLIFQVSMVIHATEWRTLTEASVPSRAHQWTFLVLTTVMEVSYLNSGSVVNVVVVGRILHSLRTLEMTPSMQVVFRSLKQREDAPLWESLTWERAIQPSITSNSKQEALNGGAVYLEQLWLSQVLMNRNLSCS